MDVGAVLHERAAARGNAIALELADGETVSYRQLYDRVEYAATALSAAVSLPAGRRPRIGIVLPNGHDMTVSLLASCLVGAALPFNPAFRLPEFETYFADTEIDILVTCEDQNSAVLAANHARIPVLNFPELAATASIATTNPFPPQPRPRDVALVLLTTGSTGRAKAVPLTHANICISAREVGESMGLGPDDRCLSMWEQYHIGGLVDLLLAPIMSGGTIICAGGFDASTFYRLLSAARPTWFQAVPTTLNELVVHAARHAMDPKPSTLRLIRSVAAALPPRLMAELESLFGVPVLQTFGMTEAGPLITSTRLPPAYRKPGSTGRSCGTQVRIVGPDGTSCEPGTAGEIAIRGDNVFSGYENSPAANNAQFHDGWFYTGDIGYLDADGDLFLTGRIKQLINRGGEKVNPHDVEDALLSISEVSEAAAFPVYHPTLGEDVAAAVVMRPTASLGETAIRALLDEKLASFKIPQRIVFLDRLPRIGVGKIDRLALSESAAAEQGNELDYTPPRNNLEAFLVQVWGIELGVGRVGIDDDFARLGGDSLSSLRIIMALEAALRVDILSDAASASRTVRSLAEGLVELGCDVNEEREPPRDKMARPGPAASPS
jgi:acyl-CoA synthetase (AMP-forming)/AMP-acid ligase II/acyl carrier protein